MNDFLDWAEMITRHHANDAGFCRHYLALYSHVLGMETQNAFEFGGGFSTKVILKALELTHGYLTTCDIRPLAYGLSNGLSKYAGWTFLCKDSLSAYNDFKGGVFDFVLHDGAHDANTVYKDMRNIVPRMMTGGLFLLHDTAHPQYDLHKIVNNLGWFKNSHVTLPYGYGLTIITIEEDFGNGIKTIEWKKR